MCRTLNHICYNRGFNSQIDVIPVVRYAASLFQNGIFSTIICRFLQR